MRGDLVDDWTKLSAEESQNTNGVCCYCGIGEPVYKDRPPYEQPENRERFVCAKCHIKFKRRVYYENSRRDLSSWGKGTGYNH